MRRLKVLATQVEPLGPDKAVVFGVATCSGNRVAIVAAAEPVSLVAARLAAGAYAVPVEVNESQILQPADPDPVAS